MSRSYYVYIATNRRNIVLYTGVTNDLARRMSQHKQKLIPGFTAKYNVIKLVYYEVFPSPEEAIIAEKKIKGWTRKKKIALIHNMNPDWKELDPSADASG